MQTDCTWGTYYGTTDNELQKDFKLDSRVWVCVGFVIDLLALCCLPKVGHKGAGLAGGI